MESKKSLRPQSLLEFIGQEKVKKQLEIFVKAAKERGEAIDHYFFMVHRV